jgi:hypothetical protein
VTPGATQNSKMIDPTFNTYPTYQTYSKDKAGKTNNYRAITYYNGNIYFTKGSGSNGIDTVLYGQQSGRPVAHRVDREYRKDLGPIGLPDRFRKADGGELHPVRPVLRQSDDALCGRRRLRK